MTLYRQLLLTMLLLFVILFISGYAVQFSATKTYLAAEQETTVINTSTALGLALTPYLETGDALGAESVINAVFAGGFYKKIQLDVLAAQVQISREHTALVQDVPRWFTRLHVFSGAKYESILTSGWLQLGRLSVEGHGGQAEYQLWQVMSRQALWFALCFLGAALLLAWALRHLLAPLHDIEQQAALITQYKFTPYKLTAPQFTSYQTQHVISSPLPLPKTRELKRLVAAINTMSAKLAVQFQQQAGDAERLRRRAFWDPTSELGNRGYFMTHAQSWLRAGSPGAVMLVSVDMLADLHQAQGFAARDLMIKQIAVQLRLLCQRYAEHAISRLSAREFALLVPESNPEHLLLLGKEINQRIRAAVLEHASDLTAHSVEHSVEQSTEHSTEQSLSLVGIAVLTEQDNASALLTRADHALSQARIEGGASVIIANGG